MDTITFRLPLSKTHHWKITKSKLAKILIISEIISILAMIWYLRVPLYQKYLAVKPSAYQVSAFDPNTRYLLSENDFLIGQTEPGYKVKLIFTAGRNKRTVKASSQGNWVAQLPKSLDHKPYRLTLAYFDSQDKLTNVESFKVLVQSENIFFRNHFYRYYLRPLLPTTVQAATIKPSPSATQSATAVMPASKPPIVGISTPSEWSSDFTAWVSDAQSKGIYPYCEYAGVVDPSCNEAGDILITDYASYANICQQTVSCYISPKAITRISAQTDPILIQSLARGEPVAYAAVATILEPLLPIAPSYRTLTLELADTTVDKLNKEEQALLDARDGKKPPFTPYVNIVNSNPASN